MARVRRLTRADMELTCKRPLQQGNDDIQHKFDASFPWTARSKQERIASNPRLKATNDDLFISGRELITEQKSQQNELRTDLKIKNMTQSLYYTWDQTSQRCIFPMLLMVVFGNRKDRFHCHALKKRKSKTIQ